MTLREQYNALTVLLLTWEPHHELLYDCIYRTRQRLRQILYDAQTKGWESDATRSPK